MPYSVIYADPAWPYSNVKTGGSHTSGAAQKYPVLSLDALKAMPVRQIADYKGGAMLFLWATVPLGRDPYDVMDAWGFEFKTEWFWRKIGRLGTGYWTRGAVEKLLIGVRGRVPAWRSTLDNWIEDSEDVVTSKPEGHSQKPEAVIRRIEALTVGAVGKRCELFATQHSAALAAKVPPDIITSPWECYGLELGHDFRNPSFWDALVKGERPTAAGVPAETSLF